MKYIPKLLVNSIDTKGVKGGKMVLDFAKEAIENIDTHSINFDDLKAGKANIKVFGIGGYASFF